MSRLLAIGGAAAVAGAVAAAVAIAVAATVLPAIAVAQAPRLKLPPGLVPPEGLTSTAPLLDHAAAPPSPRRASPTLAPAEPLTGALFRDPPAQYRPWTRWWWLGNLVDQAELRRQVALFAAKGFGGVEIQAFALGDRVDPRPPGRAPAGLCGPVTLLWVADPR